MSTMNAGTEGEIKFKWQVSQGSLVEKRHFLCLFSHQEQNKFHRPTVTQYEDTMDTPQRCLCVYIHTQTHRVSHTMDTEWLGNQLQWMVKVDASYSSPSLDAVTHADFD